MALLHPVTAPFSTDIKTEDWILYVLVWGKVTMSVYGPCHNNVYRSQSTDVVITFLTVHHVVLWCLHLLLR